MLRFLLIFFTFTAVLLGALVFRYERKEDSFVTDPQPVLSLDENVASMQNETVRFIVAPQPVRAMKPLFFHVILHNGGDPQSVMVDLSMPNMYMGMNQVTMKASNPGVYEGMGIIPVCPTGLTLWQASVIIDNQVAGNFFFDVQY
jgi:hypothetical protein